ncbi:hypothetical protein Sjap_026145 [Stephania japonica]|uniref:Glycosyltransferase n=1 Tax=Stephania japonica TaxID=461633 RepID=A0AAP0EAV9_9MAGN
MGSLGSTKKPHAVFMPFPGQGHINPMLKLAKLLHNKGFYITFVNTNFSHRRFFKATEPLALGGLPGFQFESIPDGLPSMDEDGTVDQSAVAKATVEVCPAHFAALLLKLNERSVSSSSNDFPPVSCIVSDGMMSFTQETANELGVPLIVFWTCSACGFMCYLQFPHLEESGLFPLKDENDLKNGYLEKPVNSIPGMKDVRLKDFPSFIRTTDSNQNKFHFFKELAQATYKASAIVLNTFDTFETEVLEAMKLLLLPPIYTLGPLQLWLNNTKEGDTLKSNMWKEDQECLKWLDSKTPKSVVYVNFGSVITMEPEQLNELAWGLANSNQAFLWVIRPGLLGESNAVLEQHEFASEMKERGFIASWCPQEKVLQHPSIGGFLTHSGWNSTLDAVCAGVPIISCPFFAEQYTNCRYSCIEWGIGMGIDGNIKREEVERLVRELIEGEKGKKMKEKAVEWRERAEEATRPGASSYMNFEKLVDYLRQEDI